ncbi:MAG: hypothetical protein RL653_3544 [Pseudomonadota bacterium]
MFAARALQGTFDVQAFQTTQADLVDAVAGYAPAVLLLRGVLAGGTAPEVMDQLKAHARLASVPVVVMTNDADSGENHLSAGAVALVPIPFTSEQLLEVVQRASRTARTLLYVDDSRAMHQAVVPALRSAGYVVLEAFDGREALEVLDSGRRVDLVLSDIEMPNVDGLQLCRAVKANLRLRDIPFMLLTSRDSDESVHAGFEAGADDYLMKPVNTAEMVSRVARFLDDSSGERDERVLVVDPDQNAARMLQRSLATHSLGTDLAPDAATARLLLQSERYALAILDSQGDGATLLREIREAASTSELPVIMTSATGSLGEQVRVRSLGLQSFVVKPFPPERLLAEVERTLANVRHRRQLAAMRGYLSEGAIEAIERRSSEGSSEPRAEATSRCIFFLDIVGFTTLCETLSPLAVVRFLNTFFDEVVGMLTRRGASIDKFIGDCVMALFQRDQGGCAAAVEASLEILERLPELRARTGVDVHVRIGIHSGTLVMGDIGSTHHRRDFTVIGDNVNLAARLQTNAEVDEILISDSVARMLGTGVELTPRGELTVKGRREPVKAWSAKRKPAG